MLICVVLLFGAGCGRPSSEAGVEAPTNNVRKIKVSVVKVQPAPIKDVLLLPGETKPWQDVLLAADHGGLVEWVGPEEGDQVKKGELVAKIEVSALKATLDNAEANSRMADELYQRRKRLLESEIISQEEFDQSRTNREVALNGVRQARVEYEKGFVHSPIDGVANTVFVDPGEYVAQGGAVAEIVNVDQVEIDVSVPELDVRYLKVDQPVMVRIDAYPDTNIGGVIAFVAYKADPATKTFRIKILVDNQDGTIRPGMIARVALMRRIIPDAIVAPLFAVVDKGGERVVYVEKDGVAHARTVSLGIIEGDSIQITNGLEVGDNLIITGQNDVQEGTEVLVQ
jgi:membrane fusion protein (multidrug efflux system)